MQIDVLKHQAEFIQSEATHTALVAGYGSGKSYAGILKVIKKKLEYPKINVAYYLPTYGLIKQIAHPRFSEILEQLKVPFSLHETDHEFTTPFGKIIMRSLMNSDRIVGYEVGYSLIDEADILPQSNMQDCFNKIIARNRSKLPNNETNQTDVVGTPEGFKWTYNYFVKNSKENRKIIHARTLDNPYLPAGYIETLTNSYTEQELEAYLNGQFVNLTTGSVFHKFNRVVNNSSREIKPSDVLHIGLDFNITKMSAVIHVTDKENLIAVDEIVNAYDTSEMCELIKLKYPSHSIVVYPDASGGSRKTSSSDTDIQLLKKYRFKIVVEKTNPAVKDRITATNIAFCNNKNESKYFVNINNCPTYSEALEQLTYKNGIPDKTSGHDHIADAGTYCAYHQFKIKSVTKFRISAS